MIAARTFCALAVVAAALVALPAAWRTPADAATAEAPCAHTVVMTLQPLEGDAVEYRGVRTIREAGGRVSVDTVYEDSRGETIQHTAAVYEAGTLGLVSYTLGDTRSGERFSLTREGDAVRVRYHASADADEEVATLDWSPGLRFAATVEPHIMASWARLAAGERVVFPLIVPSRQDIYTFRVVRDTSAEARRAEADGRMVVRMEPAAWLIRQLVDPLYFVLDADPPHRLREFRGRISIRSQGGDPMDRRIEYSYPDAD